MKMKIVQSLFLLTVAASFSLMAQWSDEAAIRAAMSAPTDSVRLAGLNRLIAAAPQSKGGDVHYARFSVLLSMRQDSAAFASLRSFLAAKDPLNLPGALQQAAMGLVARKKYMDSALVMLDTALVLYRREHGRIDPVLLHAKAASLYVMKRFAEAESTQLHAITLLPSSAQFDARYATFFAQLGRIQLETKPGVEGLEQIVHACFISLQPVAEYLRLDSLFRTKVKDTLSISRVRDSLFYEIGDEYIHTGEDSSRAKGFTATSYSRNGVLADRALQLARAGYRESAGRGFLARSAAAGSLGIVLFNAGKFEDAERYLNEAVQSVPLYETELILALGTVQEKLGKKKEALNTYLLGVVASRPPVIMKPLTVLQRELFPRASLDSSISAAQRRLIDFFPEKYQRPEAQEDRPNPKVTLAELFTGSECRPCQAADIAYDRLLQRYERSAVVVLEYHLHIPRPDPMTNADAEERSKYYSINSTPTSIIDGGQTHLGGGQALMAKSLFMPFVEIIDSSLNKGAGATIKLSARIRKNKISLSASARVMKYKKTYRFRVVLAEDGIRYQGSNGISDHRFVVRKMVRTAAGVQFNQKTGKAAVKDLFTVSSIEDRLERYLNNYDEKSQKPGSTFKEKKFELDPKQLYLVAFVQDDGTHKILQASMIKVNR